MRISKELVSLLGARGLTTVAAIDDKQTRTRVIDALQVCCESLEAVDQLDLAPYELSDLDLPDATVWNHAAPAVRNVLIVLHGAISELVRLFPGSDARYAGEESFDVEEAFDQKLQRTAALHPPIRDNKAVELDRIVESMTSSATTQVGDTVAKLTAMLRQEFNVFGTHLKSPQIIDDRWFLLGELQEFRIRSTKCLEAIAASILTAFATASLDEILPRYGTEAKRAAGLRAAVVDLSYEIQQYQRALEEAEPQEIPELKRAIQGSLEQFAAGPVYRYMRANDKREFILFGHQTRGAGTDLAMLQRSIEGLAHFLENMRGINRRLELARHDRRHLEVAQLLVTAEIGMDAAYPHLELTYGRYAGLDAWIRAWRHDMQPPFEDLIGLIEDALTTIDADG